MIKINSKIDIKALEDAYNLMRENNAVDVSISKGLSSTDFGLIPAIIQFFSTWYNQTISGKIVITLKEENDLSEFYKMDFLFPSLVYCWNRPIVDEKGNDLKPLLKEYNKEKYERMKLQLEGGGQQVILSCFDHLSVRNGLLNTFYIEGTFISNEMEFDFALDKSIKKVLNLNRELRNRNYRDSHNDIVAIIYELMKNTDDWGRTDEFGKPLNPNTRGLFLKLHRRTRESFKKGFDNKKVMNEYFSKESFQGNSQDELYFLEVSVYDTGIGFIRRSLGRNYKEIDSKNQVAIIKNCMIKNSTSATGMDREIKGQGLDRIMEILDNKGLFWLRTENVSVFRNLRNNRYKKNTTTDDIELYDLTNYSSNKFSSLNLVKGSVVTLVYPISNLSNV